MPRQIWSFWARFDPDLKDVIDAVATAEDRSMNWVVNKLVREALAARGHDVTERHRAAAPRPSRTPARE